MKSSFIKIQKTEIALFLLGSERRGNESDPPRFKKIYRTGAEDDRCNCGSG